MLVQADPRGEGEVRADPHKHSPPIAIIHIEVVLDDPALDQLQEPPVVLRVAARDQGAGGLPSLQDDDHLVGLGAPGIRLHELVAAAVRRLQERGTPPLRAVLDPVWYWLAMSRSVWRLTSWGSR
jgi:hypothetical protein